MPIREILAISGSLRARSSNTELLKAAALVASASLRVGLYSGLDALPHFNPDRDAEGSVAPPEVVELRSRVAAASLAETLRTMSAEIVAGASLLVPLDGRRLDAAGIAADGTLRTLLQSALRALEAAAAGGSRPGP